MQYHFNWGDYHFKAVLLSPTQLCQWSHNSPELQHNLSQSCSTKTLWPCHVSGNSDSALVPPVLNYGLQIPPSLPHTAHYFVDAFLFLQPHPHLSAIPTLGPSSRSINKPQLQFTQPLFYSRAWTADPSVIYSKWINVPQGYPSPLHLSDLRKHVHIWRKGKSPLTSQSSLDAYIG